MRRLVAPAVAASMACGILASLGGGGGGAAARVEAPQAGRTLTIYSSLPLQGDFRPQSRDIVRAMQMALADHGGRAGGHRIRYVSLDDSSPEFGFPDPELVIENARKAARDPDAIAYLGEFNSPASVFSIPITNRAGLLQVSPSNTWIGLTRADGVVKGEPEKYYPTGRRTYGRVVPADHLQAAAVADYMTDKACSDVYIVNDREDYGRALARLVQRAAVARGIDVLANDSVRPTRARLRAAARRIAAAGADCFFFGGFTSSNAPLLFKAVARRSPDITLFGPDAVVEHFFTSKLGPELEKRVFMTNPTLSRRSYPAKGQKFYAEFKARYGRYPEPYAIYGYEAMSVVLRSIKDARAAKAVNRSTVVKAFFDITDRRSVLGRYDIDENGDTTLSAFGGYRSVGGFVVFDKVLTAVIP